MSKYIFKIDGMPKDSEYNRMSLGSQIDYRHLIQEFKASAKSTHFSAKHKTTKAGFAEFKRLYRPAQWYMIDRDTPNYHDDSFEVWYKE